MLAGAVPDERLHRLRVGLHGRVAVGLLELGEDLFAVHVDRARRLDAEPHLIAANFEHGHDDLVPDHDALVRTSREHEHGVLPPWRPPWGPASSIGRANHARLNAARCVVRRRRREDADA